MSATLTVILNRTEDVQTVSLTDNSEDGFRFSLPPHSIATLTW